MFYHEREGINEVRSCETENPDAPKESNKPSFTFGAAPSMSSVSSFSFGVPSTSTSSVSKEGNKGAVFSFGASTSAPSNSSFSFGSSSGFSFAASSPSTAEKHTKDVEKTDIEIITFEAVVPSSFLDSNVGEFININDCDTSVKSNDCNENQNIVKTGGPNIQKVFAAPSPMIYVNELGLEEGDEVCVSDDMEDALRIWHEVVGHQTFYQVAEDEKLKKESIFCKLIENSDVPAYSSKHGEELQSIANQYNGKLYAEAFVDWYIRYIYKYEIWSEP